MAVSSKSSQKLFTLEYFGLEEELSTNCLTFTQEILELLHKDYFKVDGMLVVIKNELNKMPALINSNDITDKCKQLMQKYEFVSKKVLLLILQKQKKCKDEFENIVNIQGQLAKALIMCKVCRNNINVAIHQYTTTSLHILYFCRKRKILNTLLKTLHSIKTLYYTKDKLQQLLNEEKYPKAISLIAECQRASVTYKQYECVVALYCNLNDVLEQIEENLDLLLSKICTNFDNENYTLLYDAYSYLGKSQTAIDQLHMHFTASIHNTAIETTKKYAQDCNGIKYSCLCRSISSSNFISCLLDLCKSLLAVLKSYYLIINWYYKYYTNINFPDITPDQKYILKKLENGIIKIFNDIENKITIYINAFDLRFLKFEEFVQVLNVIDRVSKIGIKTCRFIPNKLYDSSKEKFINYLNSYHMTRLDELRIFLENDGWKLCPIKSSFNLTQLIEFKTFQHFLNLKQSIKGSFEDINSTETSRNYNWTEDYIETLETSFQFVLNESIEEDILRNTEDNYSKGLFEESDDEEIAAELKFDYVDDLKKVSNYNKKKLHTGPIVTNTTITVLRICGKYLQVIRFFKNVTNTVIQYIIHLFELYFYAVHSFFTCDYVYRELSNDYGTNLKRTISRIKENLIIDNINCVQNSQINFKILPPNLSSEINLDDAKNIFGLTERIIAIESLIFLGQQYESFRFYLNSAARIDQERSYLNQFYLSTIPLTISLRKPIYMASISRAFDVSNTLFLMNKVDWELKDVISQHSCYVDFLIEEITAFKLKLIDIQNQLLLSKDIYELIWETVAQLICNTLVEGFSNAKKCTNGGRALMQLDFAQFVSKFELITLLKPMPHQEYVATYIKAFYLPESSMELWIKSHGNFTGDTLSWTT